MNNSKPTKLKWHEGDWVQIVDKGGYYYTMMDQIDHPLNDKPKPINLNTPASYFRYPEYPFWINGRDFRIKPFTAKAEFDDVNGFLSLLNDYAFHRWDSMYELWALVEWKYKKDFDLKETLLELSKYL